MPGASPQSGTMQTPFRRAAASSFISRATTPSFPPRSQKCAPAATAAFARFRFSVKGTALTATSTPLKRPGLGRDTSTVSTPAFGSESTSRTVHPAFARSWAIARPIRPAPNTMAFIRLCVHLEWGFRKSYHRGAQSTLHEATHQNTDGSAQGPHGPERPEGPHADRLLRVDRARRRRPLVLLLRPREGLPRARTPHAA